MRASQPTPEALADALEALTPAKGDREAMVRIAVAIQALFALTRRAGRLSDDPRIDEAAKDMLVRRLSRYPEWAIHEGIDDLMGREYPPNSGEIIKAVNDAAGFVSRPYLDAWERRLREGAA